MSTLKTRAEMTAASEFIAVKEALESGALGGAGINRALERLALNIDALIDMSHPGVFLTGGGTVTWSGGNLSWSVDITLQMPNLVGTEPNNTVATAGSPLAVSANEVVYFVINRTTSVAVPFAKKTDIATYIADVSALATKADHFIFATRIGTALFLPWCGKVLLDTQTMTSDFGVEGQYGQQAELTTVHGNQMENVNLHFVGGGTLSWDEGAGDFTTSADLIIEFPTSAGENKLVAATHTIPVGEYLYVTLVRDPGGSSTLAPTIGALGASPVDDRLVIAKHHSDGRIYLWDGTSLSDGDERLLGGAVSGVQWYYGAVGAGAQEIDFGAANDYGVGSNSLMVYRNGIKARASASHWLGAYPGGALIGGALGADDEYIEFDEASTGRATKILWIRDTDSPGGNETTAGINNGYRAEATHDIPWTWPASDDYIEAFIGVQGQGPSPVEDVGALDSGGSPIAGAVIDGSVKLKEGTNVTLTYDVPNNAIVITASVSAGVASLEGAGGGEGAQTGVLQIIGGTSITIGDAAGSITINGDIENLADLADVSADLAASVLGATTPASTNPMAVQQDVTYIRGFETIWSYDGGNILTAAGMVFANDVVHRHVDDASVNQITCAVPADLVGGESAGASATWKYLYIKQDGSAGDPPTARWSRFKPLRANGFGRHKDNAKLKFLSSFYRGGAGNVRAFTKHGTWLDLHQGVSLLSDFGAAIGVGYVTVTLSNVPDTLQGVARLLIRAEVDTGIAAVGDRVSLRVRNVAGGGYRDYSSIVGGNFGTIGWHVEFVVDVPVDENKQFDIQMLMADGFDTVTAVSLLGFSEGRFSVASDIGA